MLPILKQISPFNHYNGGNNVQYLVLHDVGALGQVRANLNYFYTQSRGASAHLFVDDTEIGQSVEFYNPAFHVGDDKKNDQHDVGDLIHNRNSIGIEMCLDKNWKVTEKTKANTVELVKYLLKLYPNAKVVRHHDASGKICPRSMSGNNWAEWKTFNKQLVGVSAIVKPVAVNRPSSVKVTKNDTLWGISKQYDTDVKTLKSINGLKSDVIHVGDVLKLASTGTKPVVVKAKAKKYNLPTGVYRYSKGTTMKQGNDVLQIQLALSSIYFYPNKGGKNNGNDGWYGSDTANAVKRFQSVNGLLADGVYGDDTRKKLDKLVNK